MIILKTSEQIDIMHESNLIVHSILDFAENNIAIGMKTGELDNMMEEKLREFKGATSAFKNYLGYKKVSCISVNEEIVHGVPGDRIFNDGDLVSIDFGVYYNGFAGDSAKTFILGTPKNKEDEELVIQTKKSLFVGIEQMTIGNRLYDINSSIEKVAKENGYGNVRNFCGHGIGTKMHEKPSVLNYVDKSEPNIRLQEGLVLALEPMFTLGNAITEISKEDKWTVSSIDKKNAAHWELSIAITSDGPRILGK